MSILLEALKKSERQRRLGEIPTLDTGLEPQSAEPGVLKHWIPVALLMVSAGVMGWFGWQQIRPPGLDAATEVVSTEGESAPASTAAPAARPSSRKPRTPTENFQEPGADRANAPPPQSREARAARLAESFNKFEAEPGQEAEIPPSAQAGPETSLDAPAATQDEVADTTLEQAEPEAEPAARPRRSRMERQVPEPITYWELPQGVRDNLPEIRITVLVYAERPEDRFLLTNGKRLAEKDELESGLVLEEIRRDGAIFLFRKYRFLVKG